jgi:hypothetical protein
MSNFSGGNGVFTPATNADNFVLDAQATGNIGKVAQIGWGGRLTTSTGYRTRWSRPTTNATSTFTSLVPSAGTPTATPTCRLGTFLTAAVLATDPGGNLFQQDWNAHGGVGFIQMPLASPWYVVFSATAGYQQVACRNVAGVDANGSSYTISWDE